MNSNIGDIIILSIVAILVGMVVAYLFGPAYFGAGQMRIKDKKIDE